MGSNVMSQPYRMNLKGPWDVAWLTNPNGEIEPASPEVVLQNDRVKMPASWQDCFGDVFGTVRFSRRFQKPTNLDDEERVHIAFDGVGGLARIYVNGQPIGELVDSAETKSFDITTLLKPSNLLAVEIDFSGEAPQTGGLFAPVAIEIHNPLPWIE